MMEEQEEQQGQGQGGIEYNQYSLKFSKCYENAMLQTLNEIKNFCVQMATGYSIIHLEQSDSIPRIKAVVYSPTSDTYYVHCNDFKFTNYLLPRLQKFFLTPQFEFDTFKIAYDFIDDNNFCIEVTINDESTILNNSFFNMKSTSI
jgi:hypothetical protein